ncbi:MAG: hypothetical protein ABII96_03415 [Candidatus Zixiibacteriota bacterium]
MEPTTPHLIEIRVMGVGLRKEFFLLADRDYRMPDFWSVASAYTGHRDQTLSGRVRPGGR